MNTDIAFLIYEPTRKRRKNNSFDGNDNIGARVVKAVIENAGYSVGYCTPDTAHNYRLVLVSLTSTYDVYAFYRAVAMLPSWQPSNRIFSVLAGGFGMQNPTAVRNYIDYAAFGRVEDWIVPVVEAMVGGVVPQSHPSLMKLPEMNQVVFHQPGRLFDGEIEKTPSYGGYFREEFTGCPLKCKFCHYTWARKYVDERETRGSYVQESLTGGGTPELTWDQLFTYGKKIGRARVAVDGFSERLRWLYGKKISNDDIRHGLEAVGKYEGTTTVLTYNIANMPGETNIDRQELYDTLHKTMPDNRVIFVLHSTPFRPSLATPMQWEPVNLYPDWSKMRSRVIVERETLRAVHSFTLETPYSHLISVIAERATSNTDKIFHTIAFNPYLQTAKHASRLKALTSEFDISPYVREYNIDEPHPAWFLSSYTNINTLKKVARRMRLEAGDINYRPTGTSLVKTRLLKSGMSDELGYKLDQDG